MRTTLLMGRLAVVSAAVRPILAEAGEEEASSWRGRSGQAGDTWA